MKRFLIALMIVLNSCASDSEPRPPYIQNYIPDAYICDDGSCGSYPELMKCSDGSPAGNIQCIFVEDVGCQWVGDNCTDTGVNDNEA